MMQIQFNSRLIEKIFKVEGVGKKFKTKYQRIMNNN